MNDNREVVNIDFTKELDDNAKAALKELVSQQLITDDQRIPAGQYGFTSINFGLLRRYSSKDQNYCIEVIKRIYSDADFFESVGYFRADLNFKVQQKFIKTGEKSKNLPKETKLFYTYLGYIGVKADSNNSRQQYFLSPLLSGRDIFETITNPNTAFKNSFQFANFFYHALLELKYFHQLGFIHRDIKLENIMIDHDHQNSVTLIDAGYAIEMSASRVDRSSLTGTPGYWDPALYGKRPQPVTAASDIYALGVCFAEMLLHYPNIKNEFKQDLMQVNRTQKSAKILPSAIPVLKKNIETLFDEKPDSTTNGIFSVLEKMLTYDQTQRPTVDELITFLNPFYTKLCPLNSNEEFHSITAYIKGKIAKYKNTRPSYARRLNALLDKAYHCSTIDEVTVLLQHGWWHPKADMGNNAVYYRSFHRRLCIEEYELYMADFKPFGANRDILFDQMKTEFNQCATEILIEFNKPGGILTIDLFNGLYQRQKRQLDFNQFKKAYKTALLIMADQAIPYDEALPNDKKWIAHLEKIRGLQQPESTAVAVAANSTATTTQTTSNSSSPQPPPSINDKTI